MSFYGNIVNYFSAAFKKFNFLKKDKTSQPVEALLSQDVLTFESTSDNYVDFIVKTDDKQNKTVDMQLNLEKIREDLTVQVTPQECEKNMYSKYDVIQNAPGEKYKSEIKYYAKYNPTNGNLYIPFIHIISKEEE